MREPTLLCVDDDAASREVLSRDLEERYGADYSVLIESSPALALRRLDACAAAGDEVAVVLAAHHMEEMSGAEFLAAAHELHPEARRGLLITWGDDRAARQPIMRACALGYTDYYLTKPVQRPDERFHRAVTEFLDEWWRLRGTLFQMVRVVGEERSARSHEVRDLLSRNDVPFGFFSSDSDAGRAMLETAAVAGEPLPVLILANGSVLVDPTNRAVGEALGASGRPGTGTFDLTIVGGGPAGLAAAVAGGSEGLRVALLEHEALGGQAGTSSLIRNYLGFPRGISGAELAARAFEQARIFGTDVVYGNPATSLRAEGDLRIVGLADGSEVASRAVVVATGVAYRRLGVASLDALVGAGVFYGAAVAEAEAVEDESVFVVGGGNSAGQAAVHLAKYAAHVTILVRSTDLAASMSDYLVTAILNTPNIEIRYGVEVAGGGGEGRLESLALLDRETRAVETVPAAALFVLIGGQPLTGWLDESVTRDPWGYLLTGPTERQAHALETSLRGVFAVGDVRHGSIKRVASAVGEGSASISAVHEYLGLFRDSARPT